MIRELHNPADVRKNGAHSQYQIWYHEGNNENEWINMRSWNGNTFSESLKSIFEVKVIPRMELEYDYGKALLEANRLYKSGILRISGN